MQRKPKPIPKRGGQSTKDMMLYDDASGTARGRPMKKKGGSKK